MMRRSLTGRCLPSIAEEFALPYIEAMASGLPVVAPPNPGAVEVARRGADGIIASDGEPAGQLVRILEDRGLRERLSEAGLKRCRDFSWETVCARYEALYRLGAEGVAA